VLARLWQTEAGEKLRPAVLLCQLPPFGDWLACGISTQLHQRVAGFDEMVGAKDADYTRSGLLAPSIIRLGYLAVLPASRLLGSIGSIAPARYLKLRQRLSDHLKPPATP